MSQTGELVVDAFWPEFMAEIDIDALIGGRVTILDAGLEFEIVDAKPVHELGKPGRIALMVKKVG